MSAENKATVRRYVNEVVNKGNIQIVDDLFASDYVRHEPHTPEMAGPEGVKQWITAVRTAFPDANFQIEDMVGEGDRVAMRWTVRGTHRGEFLGVGPSGKQISNGGNSILRLAGGKIAEEWLNWDVLGMMQQLGAVQETTQLERNKVTARRVTDEFWNQGRLDVADEIYTGESVHHGPTPELRGPQQMKRFVSDGRGAFPDLNFTVDEMVAEGDTVVARWTFTGTQQGEWFGIGPSGDRVQLRGVTTYRLADGKVRENWANYDVLDFMRQLGASPDLKQVERNKATLRRVIDEVWNQGDLAVLDEVISPDYVSHLLHLPDIQGVDGAKKYFTEVLAAFPDFHLDLADIVAEGDEVTYRWTGSGTHKGEFMGIPPTGKRVSAQGATTSRFGDGKLVETWDLWDVLGFMQQIGVAAEAGQAKGQAGG